MTNNFNYEKAYCVQALSAFKNFNSKQKLAFNALLPMVKDLQQAEDLNIPLSDKIEGVLLDLNCQELAELSRASYFVGHWHPGLMPELFDNSAGQSWKIANVCDQVLRRSLAPLPHNIQIHEGKFRVTFSSRNCWLWDEFALATGKNLEIFKNCKLSFGENTLEASAKKLAAVCNDLWPDVDSLPNNSAYTKLLGLKKEKARQDLKISHARKLASIKKDIENSKIELAADQWLVEHDIDIDNCIYYGHTGRFCFGWRHEINEKQLPGLLKSLVGFPFPYDIKKTAKGK